MRAWLGFALFLLLAPTGTALGQCPGLGSCFVPHGLPGCNIEACCELVCDVDPFCCLFTWDSSCASQAISVCGCGAPETGSCFSEHFTPWCDDGDCCELVCGVDPFCCTVRWDNLCVSEANAQCLGCGGVSTGDCFEEGPIGCSDAACCALVCANDSFCCEESWDALCVLNAFGLCTQCGEPTSGSCTEAHSGPTCNELNCCATVCGQDPFCCQVQWDFLCANAALANCNLCIADLDANGVVDAADLGTLLSGWDFFGATDLNSDGVTNSADLSILLGAWGSCP